MDFLIKANTLKNSATFDLHRYINKYINIQISKYITYTKNVIKMDKKQYIIIALVAIIAVLAIAIGYALLTQPKASDAKWTKDPSGIKMYTCESKHTVLTSFNSEEDMTLVGAVAFAVARDLLINGSSDVETYKNYHIKENTVNDTHYYIVNTGNDTTHDNIVLASDDINILKHMLDSLVFGPPAKTANSTVESSPAPAPQKNNTEDNEDKYTEDDLRRANEEGYNTGYADGYDDSYDTYYEDTYSDEYDDYDYDYDYDYDSGESTDYETTTDDPY